jgi:hypothetical protein
VLGRKCLDGNEAEAAPTKKRRAPSWARLISRVDQADPLVCQISRGPLKIVAYITDERSLRRILDHLGLSPPEPDAPSRAREMVRVPGDDDGPRSRSAEEDSTTATRDLDPRPARGLCLRQRRQREGKEGGTGPWGLRGGRTRNSAMLVGGVEWGCKLVSPPFTVPRSLRRG